MPESYKARGVYNDTGLFKYAMNTPYLDIAKVRCANDRSPTVTIVLAKRLDNLSGLTLKMFPTK